MSTKRNSALGALLLLVASATGIAACSEDSASTPNGGSPFSPPSSPDSGTPVTSNVDGGPGADGGGGCTNKPVGCFCGTPATQQQFLNRCTNAAALPVTVTVKPATTADIP
jgi:hypothetical protein